MKDGELHADPLNTSSDSPLTLKDSPLTLKELALKSCKPVWEGKAETIRLTKENVTDPRVINLMKAIVAVPYAEAFPDPSEQESAEDVIDRVKGNGNPVQYSTASFKDINKAGKDADIIFNSQDKKEVAKANFRMDILTERAAQHYRNSLEKF
jgi:hypothetical protein